MDQGAYYQTHDIGYLDEAGNLHVLGRKSAVHRNGYTLYPEGLERKAEACGAPVKIVAIEGGRRGASLAFVIADPAAYERPNSVHVLRHWPTTTNGKVDNAALRTLVLADGRRIARTSK
jgi:non-ribosomal peptide synthetase component E (peptide arylation enzyme)